MAWSCNFDTYCTVAVDVWSDILVKDQRPIFSEFVLLYFSDLSPLSPFNLQIPSRCTVPKLKHSVVGSLPVLYWLPKYSVWDYGMPDLIAGISVGIMHLPQGMTTVHHSQVNINNNAEKNFLCLKVKTFLCLICWVNVMTRGSFSQVWHMPCWLLYLLYLGSTHRSIQHWFISFLEHHVISPSVSKDRHCTMAIITSAITSFIVFRYIHCAQHHGG